MRQLAVSMQVYSPPSRQREEKCIAPGHFGNSFSPLYTPISKNVVGQNGDWQLSNVNCTTERNCGLVCKNNDVAQN